MGYTHYWSLKKPSPVKGNADQAERVYKSALLQCAKIAKVWNETCTDQGREDERLSGFSAHTQLGKYGGLHINGKGENAHEDFIFREHFRQNFEEFGNGFAFCKTAQKPYDIVVTACLAVLKHRLGDLIDVSSDGNAIDWIEGVRLARQVLGLKIKNPIDPKVDKPVSARKTKTVKLLQANGKKYIQLAELKNLIKFNADAFEKRSIERATLLVLVDKIDALN
jgi:hypothetical protein